MVRRGVRQPPAPAGALRGDRIGENWWDVVRVEDVASACADAAERGPAGALYHVVDDQPIRFYDFVALAARALGKGPPRRLPRLDRPTRRRRRSGRRGDAVGESSNARIKSELGWAPRFPTAQEGVPDAIARLG